MYHYNDIIKIGHHGSNTSSSPSFIQTIDASVGILSVGKQNIYGHPHKSVKESWIKYGTMLFQTSEDGAIRIYFCKFGNFLRTVSNKFGIMKPS